MDKANRHENHHRQLLQSIYDIHHGDRERSERIFKQKGDKIRSLREREQRWGVNGQNASWVLDVWEQKATSGVPLLLWWAVEYHNVSSGWRREVASDISRMISMPEIRVALALESDLAVYADTCTIFHTTRTGQVLDNPTKKKLDSSLRSFIKFTEQLTDSIIAFTETTARSTKVLTQLLACALVRKDTLIAVSHAIVTDGDGRWIWKISHRTEQQHRAESGYCSKIEPKKDEKSFGERLNQIAH